SGPTGPDSLQRVCSFSSHFEPYDMRGGIVTLSSCSVLLFQDLSSISFRNDLVQRRVRLVLARLRKNKLVKTTLCQHCAINSPLLQICFQTNRRDREIRQIPRTTWP